MPRRPLEKILTEEQMDFIIREFPHMSSEKVAKETGLLLSTVKFFAFKHGLHKTQEYHKECVKENAKKARETRRKDYARFVFGLPQKTKLKFVRQPKFVGQLKWRLKKQGYIIDDKKRIAYYTEDTKRCRCVERRKRWYTFESVDRKGESESFVNKVPKSGFYVPEPPPVNDFFC